MEAIKFRAWHPEAKLMSTSFSPLEQSRTEFGFPLLEGDDSSTLGDYHDVSNLIFMQFTGCLDKNGKEIYEGDLVKWKDLVGEVQFHDLEVGFRVLIDVDTTLQGNHGDMPFEVFQNGEVIGNIYENVQVEVTNAKK